MEVKNGVQQLDERENLALFRTDRRETVTTGARRVYLSLEAASEGVTVSPDCQSIAWAPKLTFGQSGYISKAGGEGTLLSVKKAYTASTPIIFPHSVALAFGLSDSNECVVWASTLGAKTPRLLMFKPNVYGPERDLSSLLLKSPSMDIVRIGVSGSGQYLEIGAADNFAVFDVRADALLLRSSGHSASLSPTGDRIAFVDGRLGLVIHNLRGGKAARIMPWTRIIGVGGWSPDGRYVLAGAYASLSYRMQLLAVDPASGRFDQLAVLSEGDAGNYCTWISKDLL